jgi:hypothetical protein
MTVRARHFQRHGDPVSDHETVLGEAPVTRCLSAVKLQGGRGAG